MVKNLSVVEFRSPIHGMLNIMKLRQECWICSSAGNDLIMEVDKTSLPCQREVLAGGRSDRKEVGAEDIDTSECMSISWATGTLVDSLVKVGLLDVDAFECVPLIWCARILSAAVFKRSGLLSTACGTRTRLACGVSTGARVTGPEYDILCSVAMVSACVEDGTLVSLDPIVEKLAKRAVVVVRSSSAGETFG